jgi:hypothetical protein
MIGTKGHPDFALTDPESDNLKAAAEYLLQPAQPDTRVRFQLGATLHTPRVAGSEDDDEYENEAPCRAKLRRPPLPQAAEDGRHWAASAAVIRRRPADAGLCRTRK